MGHEQSNQNGEQLKFFIRRHCLALRTTMANKTLMSTWASGNRASQIDHMMTKINSRVFLKNINAQWVRNVSTDHKIIYGGISIVNNATPNGDNFSQLDAEKWDVSLLKDETLRNKYAETLDTMQIDVTSGAISDVWKAFIDKIKSAASRTIAENKKIPTTPRRRKALANVKKWSFRLKRDPFKKSALNNLKDAKRNLTSLNRRHEEEEQVKFFENLQTFKIGERINRTHAYMKKHRKRNNKANKPYIPMQNWQTGHNNESMLPNRLTGSEYDTNEVPSLDRIEIILKQSKNGKAPGIDTINMELLKYASENTIEELKQIFKRIWKENEIPAQWKETLLIPIPKIPHPKNVADYRRICLSSVGYKLYASWILHELTANTTPIGTHQAAFLQGRSTMDHAFVTKRVLEERWNAGDDTILMALDISKAFDKVMSLLFSK